MHENIISRGVWCRLLYSNSVTVMVMKKWEIVCLPCNVWDDGYWSVKDTEVTIMVCIFCSIQTQLYGWAQY